MHLDLGINLIEPMSYGPPQSHGQRSLTHPRKPNVTPTLRPVRRGRLERAWLRWPGLGAFEVMTPIAQSVQRGSPPMHSAPHLPQDSVRLAVHHLRTPYHLPCRLVSLLSQLPTTNTTTVPLPPSHQHILSSSRQVVTLLLTSPHLPRSPYRHSLPPPILYWPWSLVHITDNIYRSRPASIHTEWREA